MRLLSVLALVCLLPLPAAALDGKWTPQQTLKLDPAWLKKIGLELPPERLWDPARGTGLLAAAVNVGGCSGSFISPEGLVITNHHCAYGLIQEHSTPSRNLLEQGFLARSRGDELPGKGARVQVPKKFTDVTREVVGSVPAGADDLTRARAIERKQQELIAACEKKPATRCQVGVFDGGVQYTLIEAVELTDVRLVYAPPSSVGNYGGEIDNWMWPRHTGDFAILRAYTAPDGSSASFSKENLPFKAEFFFPLSREGVDPGDFVMVLGYPGRTFRALLAEEMKERAERFFPRVIDVYGEYIAILEDAAKVSPEAKIAVASHVKSLHNRHKNAKGQLVGIARGDILEKQAASEKRVLAFAEKTKGHGEALAAREALLGNLKEADKTWEREFLLGTITSGARGLWMGTTVSRLAQERVKPDLERDPTYMERELPRLMDRLEREQKNLYVPADQRLFAAWVQRALALAPGERIAAVDKTFGAKATPKQVKAKVASLYGKSKVLIQKDRLRMAGESVKQLRARRDPLLNFSLALADELAALRDEQDRRQGLSLEKRPLWRRAVLAEAGKPVAPDANGTLRVSFGSVQGYVPRDGLIALPQTTLSGLVQKHTGEEPFDAPEKLLQAARQKRNGRFTAQKLKDVPVNFLADGDTTGGNSGSPVVNGRGELVGINFDRVWENIANDFGFNPEVARNVSVDIRYVLWLLEDVERASELLKELGVAPAAQKSSR